MTKNKKQVMLIALCAAILAGAWILWDKTASPTKIALINFQPFQTASIVKSNADKFIKYEEVHF